jgi:UDP-N-acetylglucosamine diphosphorylase/glucosamine-1-phosphate N-acetyltransferase
VRTLVVFEDPGVRAFETLTAVRPVFGLRCGARTLVARLVAALQPAEVALIARTELEPLLRETHAGPTPPAASHEVRIGASDLARSDEVVFANGRILALGGDLEQLLWRADSGGQATKARSERPASRQDSRPNARFALTSRGVLLFARCAAPEAVKLAAHLASCLKGGSAPQSTEAFLRRELPDVAVEPVEKPAQIFRAGSVLLEHAWELVQHNAAALLDDFAVGPGAGIADGAKVDPGVHLLQTEGIHIAAGVRLRPGVVLDAEEGPITIAAGTDIQSNAVIRGPVHIGPGCRIKAGAKIHGPTSLGPVCRIGGEVEGTIVQGYSNKQHEGFLGHAFLGEWVNLGADTNNSDLKNNYGRVRMWEAGEFVDTGLLFVGLVAADHVKSAINTQFNTGTVVGLASQIASAGFPPKYIPPFTWCGPEKMEIYAFDRALETARAVMARRERELTPAYAELLRRAFEQSSASRSRVG